MLKKILQKIKNWYLEKFEDTTREIEENTFEDLSNVFVRVKLPLKGKLKFFFKKEVLYRLTRDEVTFIKKYKGI